MMVSLMQGMMRRVKGDPGQTLPVTGIDSDGLGKIIGVHWLWRQHGQRYDEQQRQPPLASIF